MAGSNIQVKATLKQKPTLDSGFEQTTATSRRVDQPWWKRDFLSALIPALASGLLLYLAFPPINWWWLAWIAPTGWLWLIQRGAPLGRRGYWAVWIAASLHWLAVLEGIRRPYWALHFGWAALSLYMATYIVLFVGSARVLVHRWRWPLWLAAPMCWIGWELARGHVITGFSGAILGHTQVRWTQLIQVADLFGAYGVSFVVMSVAACVTTALVRRKLQTALLPLTLAAVLIAATLTYGWIAWRTPDTDARPVRVALLQGTYDTLFEYNPQRTRDMFRQYLGLVQRTANENPDLDLIIWPESTFTEFTPLVVVPDDGEPVSSLPGLDAERAQRLVDDFKIKRRSISRLINKPSDGSNPRNIQQMVGVSVIDLTETPAGNYNSCLLLDEQGQIQGRYDKNHLVMFGEYIPFLRWLPQLYQYTPMAAGTTPGREPKAFQVAGLRFAPVICFETFVPHLIRRQMRELDRKGTPVDVLVNITHDGWFWGSAILDLQQACSVFRAVENRRPMLVAANPGLTTWIDGNGQIVRELPRHREDYLLARVAADNRSPLYQTLGDWPIAVCLALALFGLISEFFRRRPG